MADAYIKLHRKMLQWEWYDDTNTVRLFIHCLLKANWKSVEWHGLTIEPGQFVTSLPKLSKETGLSIQQTRTALSHMILTGEITDKAYSKYRVITVNNWSAYQVSNRQPTGNQQETNTQINSELTPIEEIKNKRIKEKYGEYKHVSLTKSEYERLVKEFGQTETDEAIKFLDEYKQRKGYKSKDDNLTLRNWVFDAVKEKKEKSVKTKPATNAKAHDFNERKYDFSELERLANGN